MIFDISFKLTYFSIGITEIDLVFVENIAIIILIIIIVCPYLYHIILLLLFFFPFTAEKCE